MNWILGFVTKETSGKIWSRGVIWETPDVDKRFLFLCGECSVKELKAIRPPSNSEWEKCLSEAEKTIDIIEPLHVPDKFKDVLIAEEFDWTFRLRLNAMIICEQCGKMVI